MSTSILSDEFSGLPVWVTNETMNLDESANLIYAASSVSDSSARSSTIRRGGVRESPKTPNFHNSSTCYSGNDDSPHEVTYECQLPSPLDDEIMFDPVSLDKERRREQNRVAQRAFRERKESKLKQLEKKIADLKADYRLLGRKYHTLQTAHLRLQSGLKILLDASGTLDDLDAEACRFAKDGED